MSKPSKLLKVVAVLVIIFSAIGLLGNLALAGSADSIAQLYGTMGLQAPGTSFYVVAILVGLISLIAGIVGVMHKSKQSVLIFGVLYLIAEIINIIYSSVLAGGFAVISVIGLVLPILYLWGWSRSE